MKNVSMTILNKFKGLDNSQKSTLCYGLMFLSFCGFLVFNMASFPAIEDLFSRFNYRGLYFNILKILAFTCLASSFILSNLGSYYMGRTFGDRFIDYFLGE